MDECCGWSAYVVPSGPISDRLASFLGQCLIVSSDGPDLSTKLRTSIEVYRIGSILLRPEHLLGTDQVSQLSRDIQRLGHSAGLPFPLLIGKHEESIVGTQNSDSLQGTRFPTPLALAAGHSKSRTRDIGAATGNELAFIGLNSNQATTLEILTTSTEPADVSRTYGDNTKVIVDQALAFAQGLHTHSVAFCPSASLHALILETYRTITTGEKVAEDTLQSLEEGELLPLRLLIDHEALDGISLTFPFEEPEGAVTVESVKDAIGNILRKRFGFQGPVIRSCSQDPSQDSRCLIHAPLRALLAGCDMVHLQGDYYDQIASIQAIYAAAQAGVLPQNTISASSDRVAAMKTRRILSQHTPPQPLPSLQSTHAILANAAYSASITALTPTISSPLSTRPQTTVLLLLTPSIPSVNLDAMADPFEPLGRALSYSYPRIRHVPYTHSIGLTSTHVTFVRRCDAVVLVLCNTSSAFADVQMEVMRAVEEAIGGRELAGNDRIARVVLAAGDPREAMVMREWGWWGVCCYDSSGLALLAAAEVLVGSREATGRLPIRET